MCDSWTLQRGRGRTSINEKLTKIAFGRRLYLSRAEIRSGLSLLKACATIQKVISLRLKRLELIEAIVWEVSTK